MESQILLIEDMSQSIFKYSLYQLYKNRELIIFLSMFKLSKRVDQAQGLEEGEISDDDLQVPPRTNAPLPPQTKTKHIPHVNQQQQESAEYVIEQVKIQPPSPTPERKKDRKELRPEDKNQWYDKKPKVSRSPDNPVYLAPPVQPLQPITPYYQYPAAMYPFHQPIHDQRQPIYPPANQPTPPIILPAYQQNSYQQRGSVQGHWNPQLVMSPNKQPMHSSVPQYPNRHSAYGYNAGHSSSSYSIPNITYQQQNKYYGVQMPSKAESGQAYQNNAYLQQQYQTQMQAQYQQDFNKTKAQQKRKQEEDEAKKRQKKLKDLHHKIIETIRQEEEESLPYLSEMLEIVKRMIEAEDIQNQQHIDALHRKLKQSKLKRAKLEEILALMQVPKIAEKLKQAELQSSLIEERKKKEAAEIFKKINRKDPRLRAS